MSHRHPEDHRESRQDRQDRQERREPFIDPPVNAPDVPPTRVGLLVLASVLLALPIVGLMWVGSYNRETPRLGGVPFFYWYQFLWVLLTSVCTYAAYRVTLVARPRRPTPEGTGASEVGR